MLNFNLFEKQAFQYFRLVDMRHSWAINASVILESHLTRETQIMSTSVTAGTSLTAVLLSVLLTGCGGAEDTVSFSSDVKPILEQNCLACHQEGGAGFEASGFSMASYDDLMKGTRFGPMVIAGDSEGSNMIVLMEGRADPSISMPHGKMDPVTKADIEAIRRWVDQGAKNN